MRRLLLAAVLAVPVFLLSPQPASANPPYNGFGCGDYCLGLFRKIHQHGPLFNYGPYYGYYPFAPYGPWDEYLRYDPNHPAAVGGGGQYGLNPRLAAFLGNLHGHGHKCGASCGFHHASWLQGGWFKGHSWLSGSKHGHGHKDGCTSCGGVATPAPAAPSCCHTLTTAGGFGHPAQSAAFYAATPTLNPVLDLVPASGTK